uniref:Chemosensory protein 21 n=1 Tax=Ectropis obliqua TaxID=248899 RepID=A0A1L2BL84_ECTOB|nr:chemosensory protein 21 [Ectropis obliqua]
MKTATVLCVFAIVALAAARPDAGKYTDRYDNVNLDEVIGNKRLLVPYINCVLEKGRCSPDGKELKSHIKEALETYCAKCTDVQRSGTRRVIGHLINHEPGYWAQLTNKYDPARKYVVRYENELRQTQG